MTANTLAHYKILEKIGEGGMGVVYRAEDTRLSRFVALKFLRAESTSDERYQTRFLREARAVAALDHPNICTVYEIGEAQGRMFLAMSYVDGPSVSALLRNGRLNLRQAIDIASQTAEGLAEAHGKGMVHRDIKPGNLLLTSKGTVKIVDFGLAALFGGGPDGEIRITQAGMAVGTPAYMAPEQWLGEDPDPRADLWSLGVVLYQALTGEMPFLGAESRTLRHSVLNEHPRRMSSLRPELTPEWDAVMEKMLAKRAEERPQSAHKVCEMLRSLRPGGTRPATESTVTTSVTPPPRRDEPPSIAVLPFVNTASDPENEYFADGITEELITGLAKIGSLRVVSRASAFRLKGTSQDLQDIGRQLNVKFLLTGSVRKAADRVRITAELVGASDGYQIWSEVYRRDARDVFAIQEELAGKILDTLKIKLSMAGQPKPRNENFEAYQLYLKGLFYWNKRTGPAMERAIDFFQQAMDADPTYPQPYCGLADSLMLSALLSWAAPKQTMLRAKNAAARALELDPTLAEAHISMAMVNYLYDWDAAAAAKQFRAGLELNPGYAIGRAFHAHFLLWTGSYEAAMQEIKEALDLDPLSLNLISNVGWFLIYQKRPQEAADWLKKALDLDPDYVRANLYLGTALAMMGRAEEAIAATRHAVQRSPNDPTLALWLARAYALSGRDREAREALSQVEALSSERYISPLDLAIVYGALDQIPRAVEFLEKAVEERCTVPMFLRDPRFDPFRDDPRFVDLVRRAGLSA
jgi:serine/threonine-protein kinase